MIWWRWAIYGAVFGAIGNLLPLLFAGRIELWSSEPFLSIWLKGAAKGATIAAVFVLAVKWLGTRRRT